MFWSFSEAWNVNFQVECDCVFFGGILHKATALVWGLLTPPNNGYAFKRRFSVTVRSTLRVAVLTTHAKVNRY